MEAPAALTTFFGCIVKPNSSTPVEGPEGALYHISNICINSDKKGSTILKMKSGDSERVICRLVKDTLEQISHDLFFTADEPVEFIAEGPHEVHIVGYQEAGISMSDDEYDVTDEEDEDEDEDEEM